MRSQGIRTIDDLRADIALTHECAYFNSGAYAPVPNATQQFMTEVLAEESGPALVHPPDLAQRAEQARQTVAGFLGARPEEIAWTHNTSAATRLAVKSLNWQTGNKLAITDTDHVSTRNLMLGLQQTRGVETTVIPTGAGSEYSPGFFLEQLDQRLTSDHRLLIMVHASNIDGRRLPVTEAVRLARDRGVKTLIDGAQAVGVFSINVSEIGADFYSGSVHKWLLGPAGIGYLVISQDHMPHYNPNFRPVFDDNGESLQVTAGYLSELGTPNYTLRMAAGHCIELFQRIGMQEIEAHVRALSSRLRDGLREVKGVRVAGPYPWELSSAITSIQLESGGPEKCHDLIDRMREEHRIVTKFRKEISGIRISVAAFNSEDEVDRLLEVLAVLVPAVS